MVMALAELGLDSLRELLGGRGLRLHLLDAGAEIPGSYWGAPEAGLVGDLLYVRPDTPVH